MTDKERKGPLAVLPQRYSSTIPPERRGRTSGKFRFDLSEKLEQNVTYENFTRLNFDREKLLEWITTGTLLKSFETWDLLPPEIRESPCEEQQMLIRFIADGVIDRNHPRGKRLPSPQAIMVELGRVLLGTIDEWNCLEPSLQMMLEHEMIEFIGQHHPEMDVKDEEKNIDSKRKIMAVLESNHHVDLKPANHAELVEEARRKVIKKITDKIIRTVKELDFEVDKFAESAKEKGEADSLQSDKGLHGYPDMNETTYIDVETLGKSVRLSAATATAEEPEQKAEKRDTIPASPIAISKSEKPGQKK